MARKINVKNTGNKNVQDAHMRIPSMLGMTLRVSQFLGAAPVRLRRLQGDWMLAVAPRREYLLMLKTIVINLLLGFALVVDFLANNKDRVRVGTTALTGFITCTELSLLAIVHTLSAYKATEKIKRLLILVQHTQKMKDNLDVSENKKSPILRVSLIMYLIWQIITNMLFTIKTFYSKLHGQRVNYISLCLFGVTFQYQFLIIALKQLQWSLIIVEIYFALNAINDRLKHLLQDSVLTFYSVEITNWNRINQINKSKATPLQGNWIYPQDSHIEIRRLAKYYRIICENVRRMDSDYGPFLIASFSLMFLQLLITFYNCLTIWEAPVEDFVIWQANWCGYHICSLIVMVEPCHRVLHQLKQTPSLLSRLLRRVGHSDARVSKELELFILDVQTTGTVLSPMRVFTISRPIVASIIGSVSTYLVIIVQMQKRSEL